MTVQNVIPWEISRVVNVVELETTVVALVGETGQLFVEDVEEREQSGACDVLEAVK